MSDLLDRRSFIGALSLTAAAGSLPGGRVWIASTGGEVGAWHVDDMWGHMPRYAHPISCRPVHEPLNLENADPADRAFVG